MFSINLEPAWDSLQQIVEHERFELHSVRYCRNSSVEVQLVREIIHTMLTNMRMRYFQLQCPAKQLYGRQVPFPNACKYHKKNKGHRIVIGWIPWDLFDAFAFWSLVPFVFDAWVVCWSVTPLGTARRKIWSTPVRVPRRLDVCDSVSYCTVVVQDDGCEGSAGLNLPGLKCPLITSGYPARLKSCNSQALWCTGAW
jgi:hypothetical protein